MTVWLIVATLLGTTTVVAQPNLVGIYTYSRDSEPGFKDERLDTFRR